MNLLRGTNPKLNMLNFFSGDVGNAVGPFLATYLIATANWEETRIGWVLLVINLATVLTQTPAGWLIDHTRRKRLLIAGAATSIGLAMVVIPLDPDFATLMGASALIGVGAAVIIPAIAAITLGIVKRQRFTEQTGANQAFNHAGTVTAAVLIGGLSYLVWSGAMFLIVGLLATATVIIVLSIPESSIDHEVARGADDGIGADGVSAKPGAQDFHAVFSNRRLVIFMICVGLFHLGNAPMLPLAGQKLALGQKELATLFLAGCVIVAQLVMIVVAALVGLRADRWGRKLFLLAGFGVLPIRGLLFAFAQDPELVLAIQILDGVGAGIYSVILFLVVADVTRGTGTFNLAQGVVITVQGVGAAFGSLLGEDLAGVFGYTLAFSVASAIGLAAFLMVLVVMPETRPKDLATAEAAAAGG
jgi:MFS family permease